VQQTNGATGNAFVKLCDLCEVYEYLYSTSLHTASGVADRLAPVSVKRNAGDELSCKDGQSTKVNGEWYRRRFV
jgi:hypothetical protein